MDDHHWVKRMYHFGGWGNHTKR